MLFEILGVAAVGGLIYTAIKTGGAGRSGAAFTKDEKEALDNFEDKFEFRITCRKIRIFDKPDYSETKFRLDDRWYTSYQTLLKTELNTDKKPTSFDCDRISFFEDEYGEKVVVLAKDIPCFDSGDRVFDSLRSAFFFRSGEKIHAIYCAEGYRIAEFILFEDVKPLSDNLKELLTK